MRLRSLRVEVRADERTRTAALLQLRVCCYRVRLVPRGLRNGLSKPFLSARNERGVRLAPPDAASVGISVGINATELGA